MGFGCQSGMGGFEAAAFSGYGIPGNPAIGLPPATKIPRRRKRGALYAGGSARIVRATGKSKTEIPAQTLPANSTTRRRMRHGNKNVCQLQFRFAM